MNICVNMSSDSLNDFEEELQQFYFDVIRNEKDVRKIWHAIGIRRALKEISQYLSYIQYDNPSKRCAYMLKHGPLLTSVVAKYFLRVIQNNTYVFQKALSRCKLSICCLSGGPASDAVAIIPVIRALYQPIWKRTRQTLKISVTVVDVSADWRVTTKNVLQCLEDTPRFFGVNEIELSYEFHQADLGVEMSDDIRRNIKKADIISMIYFLSTFNRSKGKDKSLPILEKIMQIMKKDSVLFFMNSAADIHYQLLNVATEKIKTVVKIFGPLVDEFQTLSLDSVKEFLDLYSKHFYRYMCMTDGFVSVSAWYKPESLENKQIHKIVSDKSVPRRTETEEESVELMAKIKKYRATVQRLLDITFGSSNFQPKPNHQNADDTEPVLEKCVEFDSRQSRTQSKGSPNSKTAESHLSEHLPQTRPQSKVVRFMGNREFYNRSYLKNVSQDYVRDENREKVGNAKEKIPTASEVVLCIEKVISWMGKQHESNDIYMSHLLNMKQYADKKRFDSKHRTF